MDQFCGSKFWDYQLTINTTTPHFTRCFEHTALVYAPAAILALLTPAAICSLHSAKRNVPIAWRWLNVAKLIVVALLCVVTLAMEANEISHWIADPASVSPAEMTFPAVLSASMLILLLYTLLYRLRGLVTSGIMLVAWFVFLLAATPETVSLIIDLSEQDQSIDIAHFVIFLIYYALLVLQVILWLFAENPGGYSTIDDEHRCPQNYHSFLSQVTFSWFTPLVLLGYKRPIEKTDLWSLNESDQPETLIPAWETIFRKIMVKYYRRRQAAMDLPKVQMCAEQVKILDGKNSKSKLPPPPSFIFQLAWFLKHRFGPSLLFRLLCDTFQFASPQLLKLMISFVQDPAAPIWHGFSYAVLLVLAAVLQSLFQNHFIYLAFRAGMNIKMLMIDTVFRKTLRLSNVARKDKTVGEIVNLMAVDVQRFADGPHHFIMLLTTPLQIIFALYFLGDVLGLSVISGLFVMVLLIPLNGSITSRQRALQVELMKVKDKRMKMMSEILNGIKVLKLYAWEPPFEEQIQKLRAEELQILKKTSILQAAHILFAHNAPFLIAAASFATYVLSDPNNMLTADKAFVALSLFNILRFPLTMLPNIITFLIQANVSNKRLKEFFTADELDSNAVQHDHSIYDAIVIKNGSFRWDRDPRGSGSTLNDINVTIPKGSLVAVVGQVGTGKSSLLGAVLGEMEKDSGSVNVTGSVAYVPQQAWILNSTLQENILFGRPYNAERYQRVVEACALQPDFDILPDGDNTEIGEKGINLSGGQKQRVSLARAVYQDMDIYLLDDPLSAVDSHVGKHIFDTIFGENGLLKNKTRVLVTHGLSFLKYTDSVIVLKEGTVSENGPYKDLMHKRGAFAEYLETYLLEKAHSVAAEDENGVLDSAFVDEILSELESADPVVRERIRSNASIRSVSVKTDQDTVPVQNGQLATVLARNGSVRTAKSEKGTVPKVKKEQAKQNSELCAQKKNDKGKLIDTERMETKKVELAVYKEYLHAMGYFSVLMFIVLYISSNAFNVASNTWLARWTTGAARNQTDNETNLSVYTVLGFSQGLVIFCAALLMSRSMVLASSKLHNRLLHQLLRSPMRFFDTTPLGRIFNRVGKDTDIMDGSIPNNVQGVIQCYLNVIATICVVLASTPYFGIVVIPLFIMYYFVQSYYIATARQLRRLDSVTRSPVYSHFAETISGAMSIRAYCVQKRFIQSSRELVDKNLQAHYPMIISNRWLTIRLELLGNCIVFFAAVFAVLSRHSISPGIVGLSITYALTMTRYLGMAVRQSGELETNIVSVERIVEYCKLETEAEWESEHSPPSSWPDKGCVAFDRYSVRYREGLDLVLKGLTCQVNGSEKVGVVGRTGAGKSSMTLALFRILEASDGRIVIDGIDISTIGLHELRCKLTIIPQDPVLFSGTLRSNLDPFASHRDEELWSALEHAHLKQFIAGLPDRLEHRINEGGENLSVGQRQLVCLARALLRKTKVLVLDEATAAVDMETDDLIQQTIRSEFNDSTILTIAHRLNTIVDYDKVMVLDQGNIVELDAPSQLLANRDSVFHGMAKQANLIS